MKRANPNHLLLAIAYIVLSLALPGCSERDGNAPGEAPGKLSEAQRQALISRVEGRWHAMERRDFGAVYEYATPNYRRIFPKSMYLHKFGHDIRWVLTGVDILNYDAEAAVASVAVRVMSESIKPTTLASGIGPIPDIVKEQWFFIDGEWWNNAK